MHLLLQTSHDHAQPAPLHRVHRQGMAPVMSHTKAHGQQISCLQLSAIPLITAATMRRSLYHPAARRGCTNRESTRSSTTPAPGQTPTFQHCGIESLVRKEAAAGARSTGLSRSAAYATKVSRMPMPAPSTSAPATTNSTTQLPLTSQASVLGINACSCKQRMFFKPAAQENGKKVPVPTQTPGRSSPQHRCGPGETCLAIMA